MDPTCLPRKFLTTWVSHPRCSGGQHYTLWNSYVKTLQHILPNIPDNGTINSWLPLAAAEPWTVENTRDWMDKTPTSTHDGPHPLLGDGILDHQFIWNLQDIHRQFSMNDVLFTMLWSYYYFEVTSPASGSFFSDSIQLMLLYVIQAL
jgi:hypothetical protein